MLSGADAVDIAEGNIADVKVGRQAERLGTQRLHRGLRAGHAREGSPGTWEISRLQPGWYHRAKETK
jgi:hypothetical protein